MQKLFTLYIFLLVSVFPLTSLSQSWNKVNTIPAPYSNNYWLDVYFLPTNPDYGWICGFLGQVIRTTDRGKTWAGSVVPLANQLESVCFTSPSVGYVSGMDGIFKSTNGGVSWFEITPPNALVMWGNYFLDNNYGVFIGEGCGLNQMFFHTTNGGASWTLFTDTVPNSGLSDVMLYPSGVGYAASSGKIWKTLDSGKTWAVISNSGPELWQEEITNVGNSFLVPFAGTSCIGDGNNGGMHFSTDNGNTWNNYTTGIPMFGTYLVDQRTGWACGYDREVYYTSDGGQTWIKRNCGIDSGNLDDIWFITPNEGWVVGQGVYTLGPDRQDVSRMNIVYGDLCIPGEKLDTVWVKNHSFNNSVMVAVNIYGVNFEDFSIVFPLGSFTIAACDSQMVIVRFKPDVAGAKSAKLDINVIAGASFTLDLLGNARKMTAYPKDSLLEINPAYCGMTSVDSLEWSSSSPDNIITGIQKIYGSYEIASESFPPINIYSNGVYTYYSASPSDTGWFDARFKYTLFPCLRDTIITVRAYGVSPIITADDRISFNLNCKLSEFDTIPVANTGNSELVISDYKFNNSNSAFSLTGWTSGRQFPITLQPLESDTLIIRFKPPISGSHSAILTLINNDSTSIRGRKNPFYISLSGIVTSTDVVPKDSVIDLGDLCLGDSVLIPLPVKNRGDLTATLQNPVYNNSIYKIIVPGKTFPLQMKTNDSALFRITFKPDSARLYNDTIYISSLPCSELMKIVVKANVVYSYITVEPDSITGVIQTGLPLRKTVTVNAFGNIPVTISDIKLNPPSSDWTIVASPSLPYNINPGEKVDFNIDFTSAKDTVLNSGLVFSAQSKCPMVVTIPVKLVSHSVWLLTSVDSVGFGYRKCNAGIFYDSLTITNGGSIDDTLTVFEIQPQSLPFSILNFPSLPHIIPAGVKENYIISYNASNEGIFSGSIVIDSKNLRGLSINLPVYGEFRTVNTLPSSASFDFGSVEPCADTIVKTFYLKNTGTLADSLIISKTKNQSGFEIIPQNNLTVKSGDSILVSVLMIPAKFNITGNFSEQFILTSSVCPVIHTVDAGVNIIRPRLTLEPQTLDFGNVWKDDSLLKYIDIKNETAYTKRITGLSIVPPSAQYSFDAQFPVDLGTGASLRVPVMFQGKLVGKEQARFEVIGESVCIDTDFVDLFANVPPEIYTATVRIGKYRATPGDTVTLEIELLDAIPKVMPNQLDFSVAFDKRLFYPINTQIKFRNSRQNINYNYGFDTIKASVEKQYAELLFQEKGIIIYIEGIVLKSMPDSTGLFITGFLPHTNKTVNITKIDGYLKAENICPETGGLFIRIVNPMNTRLLGSSVNTGRLIVEIQNPQEQTLNAEIWDVIGSKVFNQQIIIKKESISFDLDISNLTSGIYILTLKSDKFYSANYKFIIYR